MFKYKVVEDEYDNVVRYIPTCNKNSKFESDLIVQTMMSLAEIKALEWVEGVKVCFILNISNQNFYYSIKTNYSESFCKKIFLPVMLIL